MALFEKTSDGVGNAVDGIGNLFSGKWLFPLLLIGGLAEPVLQHHHQPCNDAGDRRRLRDGLHVAVVRHVQAQRTVSSKLDRGDPDDGVTYQPGAAFDQIDGDQLGIYTGVL